MKPNHAKLASLAVLAIILTACQDGSSSHSQLSNAKNDTYQLETKQADSSDQGTDQADTPAQDRFLVETAEISYDTLDYKAAKQALLDTLETSQAIIQYQNENQLNTEKITTGGEGLRALNLVARIPQSQFKDTFARLENLKEAKLIKSSQGAEDVTASIVDLDIRIQAVEDRLDRLQELLTKTDNLDEVMRLQVEIEKAIVERDQYLAQQKDLKDKVAFSTLTISLTERYQSLDDQNDSYRFGNRLTTTFHQAIVATKRLLENLILLIVALAPVLLLLSVLSLIYLKLIQPAYRKYRLQHPLPPKKQKNKSEVVAKPTTDSPSSEKQSKMAPPTSRFDSNNGSLEEDSNMKE